jgi:hypothetical protein
MTAPFCPNLSLFSAARIEHESLWIPASYKTTIIIINHHQPNENGVYFVAGAERVEQSSLCVDEAKSCMFVTEWNPRDKPDNILILDYEDGGACIAREKLPFFLHSMYYVANKK